MGFLFVAVFFVFLQRCCGQCLDMTCYEQQRAQLVKSDQCVISCSGGPFFPFLFFSFFFSLFVTFSSRFVGRRGGAFSTARGGHFFGGRRNIFCGELGESTANDAAHRFVRGAACDAQRRTVAHTRNRRHELRSDCRNVSDGLLGRFAIAVEFVRHISIFDAKH